MNNGKIPSRDFHNSGIKNFCVFTLTTATLVIFLNRTEAAEAQKAKDDPEQTGRHGKPGESRLKSCIEI